MREFELYLDESGTFNEGLKPAKQVPFPSQLAGVLAPRGAFGKQPAEELLREVFAAAERDLPERLHSTDFQSGSSFDQLILALCEGLERRPALQAVRLENREGVGFGAVEATYTRMVAELCTRVLEHLLRKEGGDVGLVVIGATYMVEGEAQLPSSAYRQRLQEQVAYAALRRGLAQEAKRMRVLDVRLGSGQGWRELQVCDLLSNASHSRYRKLGDEARERLRSTFAPYDWTLTVRDLDRRVDEYLDEGSSGLAVRDLAEELVGHELSAHARRAAEARLPRVLDALANVSAPARVPQLAVLDAWLEQVDEHLRDPETGYRAAQWLLSNIDAPLRDRLEHAASSLDAFTLTLQRHSITSSNHRGALTDARVASEAFDALMPKLAGRWEHGPVIIEGLIAQAVHLTDCFEYEEAARRAASVAGYYEQLSSLLSAALPNVFPDTMRSEQRGKALGTQLQAEMFAGLRDPSRFDGARRLNDEAIEEFDSESDVARQHQYRAQLETYAGEHATAREYLAKSLGVEATHGAIGDAIAALPRFPQGFALLHWWRLGASLLAQAGESECEAFATALRQSKLHTSDWCKEDGLPYPAHGIRRYQAVIAARQGEPAAAKSALGRLRRLESTSSTHPLMSIIEATADIEVAALLWRTDASGARKLLSLNDPNRRGAKELLEAVRPRIETLPALRRWVDDTHSAVGRALSGEIDAGEVREQLLGRGRLVGY